MRTILLLLLSLALSQESRAVHETISLTDAAYEDTVTVRVGEPLEIFVRVDSHQTAISGFQCFLQVEDDLAEPVPYAAPNGLFRDMDLFGGGRGIVIFADDHDVRFPQEPLPGHQLDWCYQSGISQPRPTYVVNGTACSFRLRFLRPVDGYVLDFDHDNGHFRNTLFWEGQSAIEHPFYRENALVINVIGMEFGPLPDVYLTSGTPRDSLNLVDYLDGMLNINPDSVWYSIAPLGPNTTCALDTLRQPGAYWLGFTGTGPGTQIDLEVTAHYLNLMAQDTLRVYRGDPPVIDDGMAAGEPFVSWAEDSETWLDLDDWVTDLDDPVESLRWSVISTGHTLSMVIDESGRRAHFFAPPDWFGGDTLLVRVVDPGGMADTSRLAAEVWPVNDPPSLALPDLVEVHPGQPLVLDLTELTVDIDDSWAQLWWDVPGDTSLVTARVNHAARTLTLEARPETPLWSYADIALRVTDSGLLTDLDTLHTQVSSHPPLWQPIGEVLVASGGSLDLDLDESVADLDDADSELELWIEGPVQVQVTVDPATHLATFVGPGGWAGVEWARAHARDPDGNADVDTFLVVCLQGGNPVVALVPDLVFLPGQRDTLELDPHVWDMDTPDDQMAWTVQNSGLFHTVVDAQRRRVIYTAPDMPGRTDLSWYRATDPEGHWAEDVGGLAVIDPSGRPVIFPLAEIWMRVNSVDSSLVLDNAAYDYDHEPHELTWSVGAGSLVTGTVRSMDRRLFLSSGFTPGTETLQLHVEDPTGLSADGPLVVHVTEGHAPIVSAFAPRFVIAGQTDTLRTLSSWVYDEDPGEIISWSFVDPVGGGVQSAWDPAGDRALLRTEADHRGTDLIGAMAQDAARNSDMEWISLTTLENEPPLLELAVLPNPGEPRLLDVVAVASEPLRQLSGQRVSDGEILAFTEVIVSSPTVRVHRADLIAPDGVETWRVRAVDLPGYPQVAGNATLDSLVLGSALLSRPGQRLISPDGNLRADWVAGDGRWVVREREDAEGTRWDLRGPAGGRVRLDGRGGALEVDDGSGWRALTAAERREGVGPALRVRPATGDAAEEPVLPGGFVLEAAWPNPFNPETTLRLQLPREGHARVEVHDLAGRRVRVLLDAVAEAGTRTLRWDGRDADGVPVASGVYLVQAVQGEARDSRKLLLVK
jgi:hypothetical protein